MGWLEGLISGYADQRSEIEKENTRQAENAAAREGEIYKLLLSHEDPEIASMAATGLLTASQPAKRKGGLQGWFGETRKNPIYPQLLQYFQTPQLKGYKPGKVTEGLPPVYTPPTAVSNQTISGQVARTPQTGAAAALPATSPTEPGTPPQTAVQPVPPAGAVPPPAPPSLLQPIMPTTPPGMELEPPPYLQAPPTPTQFGQAGERGLAPYQETQPLPPNYIQRTVTPPPEPPMLASRGLDYGRGPITTERGEPIYERPRMVPTTEETAVREARAKMTGLFESYRQMFARAGSANPEKDAADLIVSSESRAAGRLLRGGLVQEPDGTWVRQWLHPITAEIVEKTPEAPPGTTSARAPNITEQIAHTLYARPGEDAKTTFARVQREPDGAAKMANIMKRQQYHVASAPLTQQQRFADIGRLQDDWNAIAGPHRIQMNQMLRMRDAWTQMKRDPNYIPVGSEIVIVTFQRMLDENSVVREAEARRPGTMQPILDRIPQWIQQIRNGGAYITLDALETYLHLSEDIMRSSERVMAEEKARIDATADQFGLSPLNLLGATTLPPPPAGFYNNYVPSVPDTPAAAPPAANAPPAPPAPNAPNANRTPAAAPPAGNVKYELRNGRWVEIVTPTP